MSADWTIPGTVHFLEALGFEFSLDWDDELSITYPDSLTGRTLANELAKHSGPIVRTVKFAAASQRRQFMGGPYNGRQHGRYEAERIAIHICRAKWAVYVVAADGRAWFRGYARSRAKAKRLESLTRESG